MKKIILTLIFALIISLNINAQYNKLSGIMTINGIKVTSFTNINYQLENDDVVLWCKEDDPKFAAKLVIYKSKDYFYSVEEHHATPTCPAYVMLHVDADDNAKNYAMKLNQLYNYVVKTFKLKSVPKIIQDNVDELYIVGYFKNYTNMIVYSKEFKDWKFIRFKE